MATPLRTALLLLMLAPALARADRAASEAAFREGEGLLGQRHWEGAIAAFTRAIEADRSWAAPWTRRGFARYRQSAFDAALEDLTIACSLDPGSREAQLYRVQAYLYLDRVQEAVEVTAELMARTPGDADLESLHGRALVRAGDVDGGLALQTKAWERNRDPGLPVRSDGFLRKADWASLRSSALDSVQRGAPSTILWYHAVIACVESGDFAKADEITRQREAAGVNTTTIMCRVTIQATPGAGAFHNPAAAQQALPTLLEATFNPEAVICAARAWVLTGRSDLALDLLSTRGRRANFECLFWLGAAYWAQGMPGEARAVLTEARRFNPYLAAHGVRVGKEFDAFLASLGGAADDGHGAASRGRLGHELATHLLTVAEIEHLVRRYRFSLAATEYDRLLQSVSSAARKKEIEVRLPEVRAMSSALAKLVQGINSRKITLKTTVGRTELAVRKATEELFEFSVTGGEGKFPWACLDPGVFCDFALQASLTPEDTFGLGCLAWEAGLPDRGTALLLEANRKKPALAPRAWAFLARRRGMEPPAGGFVLHRGRFVTPEEKENLEKGLVRWQDGWVPVADREQLQKGMIRVGGAWVKANEADLLGRGCRLENGRWLTAEEYSEFHSAWENAWVRETPHWTIRTNESESFAKDLAELLEPAWAACRSWHDGAEPKLGSKDKMTLFAFRTWEDYRRHCVAEKAEDHLAAAGFAKSDSLVACGWNKTGNARQFLQTMVHEAAHLYYFRAVPTARPKSWYAEAMATWFEGFEFDGKAWKFGTASESRLPFVRDAMKAGRHIPLKDIFDGQALALINSDPSKALLFYAECWSLSYYLTTTSDKGWRAGWAAYRESVARGRDEPFLSFFSDPKALEADWVRFVTGL